MADTDTGTDAADTADTSESTGLGPMPDPRVEEGEPPPGGVDALPEPAVHVTPDLSAVQNPALGDRAPDEVVEQVDDGEDTSTAATESSGSDGGGDAEQQLETSE
jgi:hypothetical protein